MVISDDDKYDLIRLWEGVDVLHDVLNPDYHNNNKQNAALKRIAEEMAVDVSYTQVKDVMKSLWELFLLGIYILCENKFTWK